MTDPTVSHSIDSDKERNMTQCISLDPGRILALHCPKCVFLTLNLSKLCEHCSTHQDKIVCQLFQCSSCGVISSNANLMMEHLQALHPELQLELKSIMSLTLNEGNSQSSEKETTDGPFRCLLCSSGTNSSESLQLHYQNYHNIINANTPMIRLLDPGLISDEFQMTVENSSPDLGIGTSPSDLSLDEDRLVQGITSSRSIKSENIYDSMDNYLPSQAADDSNNMLMSSSIRSNQSLPSSSKDGTRDGESKMDISKDNLNSLTSNCPQVPSQLPSLLNNPLMSNHRQEMNQMHQLQQMKQQQYQQEQMRRLQQLQKLKLQQNIQQQQQHTPSSGQTQGWKMTDEMLKQFDFAPRKSIGRWRTEDMVAAFEAVTMQGMTLRKAARNFNVPFATLQRRLSGKVKFMEYYGSGRAATVNGSERWNPAGSAAITVSTNARLPSDEDSGITKEESHEMKVISEQRNSTEIVSPIPNHSPSNSFKTETRWTLD